MIDELTRSRLRVSADGVAGPYLMVPLTQLPRVRKVLDRHGVRHWTDSQAISLDGRPAVAVVSFGRGGDAAGIQRLLDEAG
jgi:hypothetical protein